MKKVKKHKIEINYGLMLMTPTELEKLGKSILKTLASKEILEEIHLTEERQINRLKVLKELKRKRK